MSNADIKNCYTKETNVNFFFLQSILNSAWKLIYIGKWTETGGDIGYLVESRISWHHVPDAVVDGPNNSDSQSGNYFPSVG